MRMKVFSFLQNVFLLLVIDNINKIVELEPMIWHQISRLYFCEVHPEKGLCNYTENEKKYGFRQVLYTLEEAIVKNRSMLEKEGKRAWNQREYKTLLLIKDYLAERNIGI